MLSQIPNDPTSSSTSTSRWCWSGSRSRGSSRSRSSGGPLFNQTLLVYLMYVSVVVVTFLLFETKWGLRVRSVGEHPKAADTVGIKVNRVRWQAVLFGGVFAGLGGAYFTVGSTGSFDNDASAGNGFIALAAVIMGRWHPIGATFAALFFGFTWTLQAQLQVARQDPGRAAAGLAVPRHDHRRRRLRRPGPPAGGRRRALREELTMSQDFDWAALTSAAVEVSRAPTCPTATSRWAPPRSSTTAGWSWAATSRTRRTASRCAPSAGWCRRCTPPAAAG